MTSQQLQITDVWLKGVMYFTLAYYQLQLFTHLFTKFRYHAIIFNILPFFVVRMTVLFTDHRYLVVRECFDYTANEVVVADAEETNSSSVSVENNNSDYCPRDKSSLSIYSKSRDFSLDLVSLLTSAASLPAACSSTFQLTLQGTVIACEFPKSGCFVDA